MPLLSEALVSLVVPVTYLTLLAIEPRHHAREFAPVRWWRLTGTVFFAVLMAVSLSIPQLLPADFLAAHRIFNLTELGFLGVVPAVLVSTFFGYWFHRGQHRFDWMWRSMHQLHHSALRVDMAGAFFTHPTEMVAKILLGTLTSTLLLGVEPVAASAAASATALLSMFQHWNVRTPVALGYFVQRPESHCLHHERNVHARNYSELPLWDILFGTFANPGSFAGDVGFDPPASRRVLAMLLMRDVNRGKATQAQPQGTQSA